MRFQVQIPPNLIPAAAGSSIHVYEAGTTNHLSQTLYADGSSSATLANPYTHPGGKVNFFTTQPVRVSIGVQPAGAASPVIAPVVTAAAKSFAYGLMKAAGQPVAWVLS
jgi:hypothetical protein